MIAATMQRASAAAPLTSTRKTPHGAVSPAPSSAKALPPRARTSSSARRSHVVAAAQLDKPAVAQFADSIGLPTSEGLFGFKPFAEVWVGRLAMMGFVVSIVEEAMGNGGTLAQIGLTDGTPSPAVFALLAAVFGTATLTGTVHTAYKLATKKMTAGDIARYKNFLGLNNPNDFVAAAAAMKAKGDFTSLRNDSAAIAAARAAGMPADKVLGVDTLEQADAAASELKQRDAGVLTLSKADEAQQVVAASSEYKAAPAPTGPSVSLAARADIVEQDMFSASGEMRYARDVELTNGRAAMLGFLSSILVEAATGKGILLQLIMYFKLVGLLGPESGF